MKMNKVMEKMLLELIKGKAETVTDLYKLDVGAYNSIVGNKNKLKKMGLIKIKKKDGRTNSLVLTDKGKKVAKALLNIEKIL